MSEGFLGVLEGILKRSKQPLDYHQRAVGIMIESELWGLDHHHSESIAT